MIRFFRIIRQKLLTKNKFSKYLMYAIGEIILVVIGILIALSINNWNNERLDKKRAIEYHLRLVEDLNVIIGTYKELNVFALEVMNSITRTVEVLEKGSIESDEEKKVIDFTLVWFSRLSRQISDLSTYEEMKNNGDINLIYNIEIRNKIDELQSFIELGHEIWSKHALALRNDISSYSKYYRTYVDSETLTETIIPNFDAMAADPQFINQFSCNISSWGNQADLTKQITNFAIELKKEIRIELETLQE